MNKKLKIAAAIGASFVLAGCDGLVDNPSASNSGSNSVSIGPSVSTSGSASASVSASATKYDLKTGQSKELPGASLVVESGDENNIAIEQGTTSAIIYAMNPGVVLLSNGSEKFELTISYGNNSVLEDGNDYKQVSENVRQGNFRGEGEPTPYTIGIKNAFVVDMEVGYRSWKYNDETSKYENELVNVNISEASKHLIGDQKINFDIKVTGETDVSEFVTVNEDATLQFSESAIGKEISVSIGASFAMNTVTQTYSSINAGYNAYDNDSFKALFQDRNIEKINVLRSFEAKLDESQYYFNTRYQKLVPFNTLSEYEEINYQGSLYFRYGGSNHGTLLPLEVNGNYMQIDGSKLPEHVAFIKSEEDSYPDMPAGFAETQAGAIGATASQEKPVVNPHSGIFRVSDFGASADQETKLTLNNLSVLGASVGDDIENPTLHAGGFVGAFFDGIVAEFNNCNMQYLVYGAQINYHNGELRVKDCKIQDTWGPSITTWMAKSLKVENTLLTKAGGPMIWAINCYGREEGKNGSVILDCQVDNRSDLTNYMKTDSSWFSAYNMDISMQAQSIEAIMKQAGYSIYKAGTQQLNFVSLVQHGNDYSTYPAGANITIGGQSTFVNPIQFTDQSSQFTQYNPFGAGVFAANNSLLLAFGQVIDQTIVNSTDMNVVLRNYVTQLATKLGTYRAQGETHLYLEVDARIGNELLAAIIEVTPLQAA